MADETDWETEGAAGPVLPRPSGGLLRTPPNFRGFPERKPPLIDRPIEKEAATQGQPDLHMDSALRSAQADIGNVLRDEIRNGFLDMMKLLNDLYRPPASVSKSERNARRRTRSGYAQQPSYSCGTKPSAQEIEIPPGEPEPPPEDVEEASTRPRLVCWNCGKFDHMWRDCLSKEQRIYILLPFRQARYLQSTVRRMSGKREEERGMTMATRRILKARARFRRRRMTRRQIIEALQRDDNTDPRVFADVEVAGSKMKSLLNTGASVSLLGRGCRELVEELEWPVQPYASIVRTVAGAPRPILGRVVLPVKYKERVKEIVFYMCLDLQQELYLGIDFWRAFEIAPDVLGAPKIHETVPDVSKATVANTDISYYRDEDDIVSDPETWNLEERQVTQLEAVKREFLQFEKDSLGKTHLLQHRIQLIEGTEPVKDRHYPLSPAKQEIVWAEVDKMLQLGNIEERDSPWSNRITR
ncbi:hypothetical protein ACLKA7_001197 [Drosophila subpalustris]